MEGKTDLQPEMIVIAGPNGSGKTSVTRKFLHHEWAEGVLYINPDEIAKDMFGDWNSAEAVLKAAFYIESKGAGIFCEIVFHSHKASVDQCCKNCIEGHAGRT